MSQPEPLRLGIVGTGFIGVVHARCAMASAATSLVAVASARGPASRERVRIGDPSVRMLTFEQVCASDEVEAVVVCTRTTDHADDAVAVLRAGKHLLLEKPGAATLAEHQRIVDAAAAHPDRVVRVAYHRRHDPQFRALAERIAAGEIGEPYAVQMTSREDYPPSDADRYAGGFILDVGSHDFDTARWLLARDAATVYTQRQAVVFRGEDLDNAYVTVGLRDAIATTHLSRTSRVGLDVRCEVLGTAGSLLLTDAPLAAGITLLTRGDAWRFPADCRARFPHAYQKQIDDFAAACRGEVTPNATLSDDRLAVATGVAARASAAQGEPLAVGPDWTWTARRDER